jgi:ABC-type Fe3+-siderophore transport system, permease component
MVFKSSLPRQRRFFIILLALTLCALVMLTASILSGSVSLSPSQIFAALTGSSPEYANIVFELRLPRALAAFACGGLLALAGAMMQLLLRNPLADPYVLGVSGGAAVGALCALLLALPVLQAPLALIGALLSTLLVWFGAFGFGKNRPTTSLSVTSRLLLTGVVIAAGWGAIIVLLLTLAPDAQLRGALTWLMGDLSSVRAYWPAFVILAFVLVLIWPQARHLNRLAQGTRYAEALGVPVPRVQLMLYLLAALATAAAVVTAGCLPFIGLIVPHALRLMFGNDQRILLPACVLGGGVFLMFADVLARTIAAPYMLPTGVLTALIGVPVFLFLLRRA